MILSRRTLPLLVVLMACSGCSDGLVDVRARVTLDGKPLEKASVTLVSSDGKKNRSAFGTTDADGYVRFSTFAAEDGVAPGDYKVTVNKAPDNMKQEMDDFDKDNPEDVKRILMLESGHYVPFMRTGLPRPYLNARDTPLSCTVPSEGELTFDLDSSLGKRKPKSRN